MNDSYVYPALFTRCEGKGIGVAFPDFPGCVAEGRNDEDALRNAKKALLKRLWELEEDRAEAPRPTPVLELEHGKNSVVVLLDVWMPSYRDRMLHKATTRAVSLPLWLDRESKAAGLNYSRVLQEGLMERLGIFGPREYLERVREMPYERGFSR